jgi:hypothetical protein
MCKCIDKNYARHTYINKSEYQSYADFQKVFNDEKYNKLKGVCKICK